MSSDLQARKEHGTRKYGHALQTENGRNFLLDFYEEILDASVYVRGELEERKKLADMLEKLLHDYYLNDEFRDYFGGVIDRLRIGL